VNEEVHTVEESRIPLRVNTSLQGPLI